eukprot:gene35078-43249_t
MCTIPLEIAQNGMLLDLVVSQQSETLFSEVLNVGSMMGFEIRCNNVGSLSNLPLSCALILSLLESGLAYVTSESGKVMALFPTRRSVLKLVHEECDAVVVEEVVTVSTTSTTKPTKPPPLTAKKHLPPSLPTNPDHKLLPAQLAKRLHEMPRIFRQKVKKTLSLRLNSKIPLALQKLREHHGADCWIGPELETVWLKLASVTPPKLFIFELFYGEELIAADFGHPVFNREDHDIKVMMSGFLLALIECKVLKQLGCHLWDLGGVNSCPLMRYKLDLTGTPIERPAALYEHQKIRKLAGEMRAAEPREEQKATAELSQASEDETIL